MDADQIRKQLLFGMPPLTIEQQRWLFNQAFPEAPLAEGLKRCKECWGEGCRACEWTGKRPAIES